MTAVSIHLFYAAIAFVLAAATLELWMIRRLSKAGVRMKWFTFMPFILALHRQYRSLARARNWSVWPARMLWILNTIWVLLVIFLVFFS
jgi:hypothetical protein